MMKARLLPQGVHLWAGLWAALWARAGPQEMAASGPAQDDNPSLLCALLKRLPQTVCMMQYPGMTGLCKDDSLAVNELSCFD